MFDHIGFRAKDLGASTAFYEAALAPLGGKLLSRGEGYVGFGQDEAVFWVYGGGEAISTTHLAFRAASREAVDAFHAAALAAGGRDNGGPGLREDYGPSYYAAFVTDPDGANVEAVCLAEAR